LPEQYCMQPEVVIASPHHANVIPCSARGLRGSVWQPASFQPEGMVTLPAGVAGGEADATGADAVAVAMGAEGIVLGVSDMMGETGPVAVPGPVVTATAAALDGVAGAAAGEDAAGGLVGAGALAEGGGTDGTLPPAAPRPNWAFWQVPEHFWYKERRFPAPHS
jgi:hypothetical protein